MPLFLQAQVNVNLFNQCLYKDTGDLRRHLPRLCCDLNKGRKRKILNQI